MTGLSLTPISKELYRTSPINYTDYKKEKTLKNSNLGGPILYGYYSSPAR